MIISDLEIAAARDQAEAAERELAEAEHQAMGRSVIDEVTAASLTRLTLSARTHRAKVVDLESRQAEQRRELEARASRESKAAKALAAAERELAASQARLVAAVTEAEAATSNAVKAAQAHDELVARHRTGLAGLGLLLSDVTPDIDHATGAAERVGLRLHGRHWAPVEAGALLARTAWRVARATLGQEHPLTARLRFLPGVADLGGRSGGVLADVPDMPDAPARPRLAVTRPHYDMTPVGTKPYLETRARRPDPDPNWRENFRAQFGVEPPQDAA